MKLGMKVISIKVKCVIIYPLGNSNVKNIDKVDLRAYPKFLTISSKCKLCGTWKGNGIENFSQCLAYKVRK